MIKLVIRMSIYFFISFYILEKFLIFCERSFWRSRSWGIGFKFKHYLVKISFNALNFLHIYPFDHRFFSSQKLVTIQCKYFHTQNNKIEINDNALLSQTSNRCWRGSVCNSSSFPYLWKPTANKPVKIRTVFFQN